MIEGTAPCVLDLTQADGVDAFDIAAIQRRFAFRLQRIERVLLDEYEPALIVEEMPTEHGTELAEIREIRRVDAHLIVQDIDDHNVRLLRPEEGAGGLRAHAARFALARLAVFNEKSNLAGRVLPNNSTAHSALFCLKIEIEISSKGARFEGRSSIATTVSGFAAR